ncbi:MAG: macro domain-containing protein [Verrucomicrobiaceae bacterium]|nr:macro domain-containing protein [Verrucomicrobiaceae bacterium]
MPWAGCGWKPGLAKMTKGYKLKARHVIWIAGPVWQGGGDWGSGRSDIVTGGCQEKRA